MRTVPRIALLFCALTLATPALAAPQTTTEESLRAAVFRDDRPVRDKRIEPKKPEDEDTSVRFFPAKDVRDPLDQRQRRPFESGNGLTIFSVTIRR